MTVSQWKDEITGNGAAYFAGIVVENNPEGVGQRLVELGLISTVPDAAQSFSIIRSLIEAGQYADVAEALNVPFLETQDKNLNKAVRELQVEFAGPQQRVVELIAAGVGALGSLFGSIFGGDNGQADALEQQNQLLQQQMNQMALDRQAQEARFNKILTWGGIGLGGLFFLVLLFVVVRK